MGDELSLAEYWAAIAFGAMVVVTAAKMLIWDRFVRRYR